MRRQQHSSPARWAWLLLGLATFGNAQINPLAFQAADFRRIEKRQNCISNFYSCADQGAAFEDVCCQNGQTCSLDRDNNPGCCPQGAVCTGTVPTKLYSAPTGAAAVSYVQNSYFAFPYIATSFAGAGACTSALSQCSSNLAACTQQLEGGHGVTIAVGGAGMQTTVAAQATLPGASATSVCRSLSSEACFGLQGDYCAQTGTANGFFVGTAAGARPTPPPVVGVLAAGLGLGVMAGL